MESGYDLDPERYSHALPNRQGTTGILDPERYLSPLQADLSFHPQDETGLNLDPERSCYPLKATGVG